MLSLLPALILLAAPPTVTLAAVGDVLLARTVPQRIDAHGPAWLWAKLPPEWASADLRFCNLECPVTTAGVPVRKRFCFKADPPLAEKVLRAGRIDVASVANNHTYDYQTEGVRQTRDWLAEWGILPLGIGTGRAGAVKPVVLERNGLKIAWLAYTDWTPESYVPVDDGPALATLDDATLADEVRATRAAGDVLVVSVHWGLEYNSDITERQRELAHAMIDAGADLVLGHHPHVAEPVEIYHERPICYSLGNCIFDRSGARVSNGLLVVARLASSGAALVEQVRMVIEDARPVPAGA